MVVVSASREGVCHHIGRSWPGLFFRFRSWKSMLDRCTLGLPHLSLRVAELGAPGRVRKEEAKFNMFEYFVFSCALMEECIFGKFGF